MGIPLLSILRWVSLLLSVWYTSCSVCGTPPAQCGTPLHSVVLPSAQCGTPFCTVWVFPPAQCGVFPPVGFIPKGGLFPGWFIPGMDYFRNVRTVEYTRGRNTLRINPAQRGNRGGMLEKPATESTCVQGMSIMHNPSFPDQNCNLTTYEHTRVYRGWEALSARFSSEREDYSRLNKTVLTRKRGLCRNRPIYRGEEARS